MRFQRAVSLLSFLSIGLPALVTSATIPLAHREVVRRDKPEFYSRNLNTITSIYDFTIYPSQLPIIAQATSASIPQLAPLFSPNVAGRIQDVGSFTNFRTSIEYFFGLAPTPYAPRYLAFSAIDIIAFASDCPDVAASTVEFTISVADPSRPDFGTVVTYLKQTGFWHFDEQGRVDYYDLVVPALGDFCNVLQDADFNDRVTQLIATKQICEGAQEVCKGANVQYTPNAGVTLTGVITSLGLNPILDAGLLGQLKLWTLNAGALNCVFQLSKKGFGSFDKLWDDTVTCRIVHLVLAKHDPEEHCPHVGPSGGGKCVKLLYEQRLFNEQGIFGDKHRFMCPS